MFLRFPIAALATATVLGLSLAGPIASSPYFPETPLPTGEFKLEKQASSIFDGVGDSRVKIHGENVSSSTGLEVLAGGFAVKIKDSSPADNFIAWCVDTFEYLDLRVRYEVTSDPFSGRDDPDINEAKQSLIANLFDTAYDTLLGAIPNDGESAAFQLALWEIVNETGRALDVTTGAFYATVRSGGVLTRANALLAGLDASAERKYNLVFLEAKGTGQDLLTVVPVPVPASALLLLGALGGLGSVAHRRRRRA